MDRSKIIKKEPMGVISKVYEGYLADELGLEENDIILEINDQKIEDLIDFEMVWTEEEIKLKVLKHKTGKTEIIEFDKDYDEMFGVEFESAVFDGIKNCKNKCIFCFVDQMAPNLRESLYEKDDDYRLSFLQGSFITLTNLKDEDVDRIKRLHLSPLYVSVHVTDPDKRVEMVKNPESGKILERLREFVDAGISFHTQIVLVKGVNDGEYLEKSIKELSQLGDNILSLAVVPVGITKYRKDKEDFKHFSKEDSIDIIEKVEKSQEMFREERGNSFVYLADEFYIKAQRDFPIAEYYDGFPQIENGIGLSRLFIQEYEELKDRLPNAIKIPRKYYFVSGLSAATFIKNIVSDLNEIENLEIELLRVKNNFFGERVNVTGLLTGSDLIEGLKELPEGAEVVIPQIMLRNGEKVFLDNLEIKDIEKKLNIKILKFDNSFADLKELLFEEDGGNI